MLPNEVIKVLRARSRSLSEKRNDLVSLNDQKAKTKKEYAEAFATKITTMTIAGEKATIVKELANGDAVIAKLRYKKDIAKGVYDACNSSIKCILADMDIYRSILAFEKAEIHNN